MTKVGQPAGSLDDDATLLRAARALPARVDQVAKVLQIDALEVLEMLAADNEPPVSTRAMLTGTQVQLLLADTPARRPFRSLGPTLQEAFPRTPDGERKPITTAVLKNRLMDLTDGSFDEAEYGTPTVRAFVRLFPSLLNVQEEGRYTIVQPIDSENITTATSPTAKRRIRPDLWRASLDYASRLAYVWDPAESRARPLSPGDEQLRIFPTLTPDDIASWRLEFIRSTGNESAELAVWAAHGGKTTELPPPLRPAWSRSQSERVIAHIQESLAALGATEQQIFEAPSRDDRAPSQLRSFLHRYIDAASETELGSLSLDPRIAMRLAI